MMVPPETAAFTIQCLRRFSAHAFAMNARYVRFAPRSISPSMSCLVTRPAKPVPGIVEMSTRCSAAILRTSGVDLRRNRSAAVSAPSPPFTGAVEGGRGREGAVAAGGDDATAAPEAAGARWAAAEGAAVAEA